LKPEIRTAWEAAGEAVLKETGRTVKDTNADFVSQLSMIVEREKGVPETAASAYMKLRLEEVTP
jgi:hypothetical protein